MFFIPPSNNWSTRLGFYTCISTKYQLSLQSCTYKLSIHSRWIIASKVGRNYCFILLSYHIIHIYIHYSPAGDKWGQLLIFSSFRVSLLFATRTFKDGSSSGVSSILIDDNDLEFTKTTVSAEAKWACLDKLEEGKKVLWKISRTSSKPQVLLMQKVQSSLPKQPLSCVKHKCLP